MSQVPAHKETPVPFRVTRLTFNGGISVDTSSADIIILVGPNNTGKTRTLQEIHQIMRQDIAPFDKGSLMVLNEVAIDKAISSEELASWLRAHRYMWRRPNDLVEMVRTFGAEDLALDQVWRFWDLQESRLGALAEHLLRTLWCGERLQYHSSANRLDIGTHPDHAIQLIVSNDRLLFTFRDAFWTAFKQHLIVDGWGNTIRLRLSKNETQNDFEATTSDGLPRADVVERLSRLPLLESQSDGVRSFTGMLLTLLTTEYPLVLIDEPEAFLHPPQARLLGRYLTEMNRGGQIFIATHSLDVLLGLVESKPARTLVVRLTRDMDLTSARVLPPEQLTKLWSDPLLRFSRALDGLFHQGVVVCEGDTDAQFYAAVAARKRQINSSTAPDVMFTYAGTKNRIPLITRALDALGVPVRVVVDFDALNERQTVAALVKGLGHNYTEGFERDRAVVDR